MILIGAVLLALGLLINSYLLWSAGVVVLVVGAVFWLLGAVFWLLGAAGRPIAGRRYWC
ncbi:DUF6131 family protein [Mycolicibacterium llatzerense]|uniref:DUF6131 family protein n=1 Tax=Mycolicibacterium llatzerense TaxID=280871 RepID=UPI000ADA0855|nr:DUF6131 family protein [Mycolicibacterium llatzerense]